MKDALERGLGEGRARLDDARRERRRDQALARLGEAVLAAVRAGELAEVLELPDAADALAELDALEDPHGSGDHGRDAEPPWVAPRTRERFDRRAGSDDDGTVSSASWRPRPPTGAAAVWRPPRDEAPAAPPADKPPADKRPARDPAREPGARFAEPRKGGIQFAADDDDDDDLASYMNPDDVPPKR